MTETAYIGIGSNLGDRYQNCLKAVDLLRRIPGVELTGISGWYLTKPVGVERQEWFINGVLSLEVKISAQDLLKGLMAAEQGMGRVRTKRWGPRIIDLDILLYGNQIIDEDDLKVPHPLMHVRRFVLVPIADLAPEVPHPSIGLTMSQLLDQLHKDGQDVIPYEE